VLNAIAQTKWIMDNYMAVSNKQQPNTHFVTPYYKIRKGQVPERGAQFYVYDGHIYPAAQYWSEHEKRVEKKTKKGGNK